MNQTIKKSIKYTASSLISTAFEFSLFFILKEYILDDTINKLLVATILGRILGVTINFFINKYWCFEVRSKTLLQAILFFILFLVKLFLSYLFVKLLSSVIQIEETIIKAFVDTMLFFLGYVVQNYIIFKKRDSTF